MLKASSIPSQGRENGRGSSPSPWGRAGERLALFYEMIASFHESSTTDDAYTLALRVAIESGLRDYIFSGHDPEDVSKQENLQEMLDGIATFVQDNQEQGRGILLAEYLQVASLATDFDRNKTDKDADQVNMMTIHSAKGLEFPVVFIAGLEEGLFPSEMSADSPRALEEERRLFYVALTRAERQVILTFAKSRFRNGRMEFSHPSRFIKEIPQQYFRQQTTQQTTDNRALLSVLASTSELSVVPLFWRICNPPETIMGMCQAKDNGLQILIFKTAGLQIQPNKGTQTQQVKAV